MNRYGVRRLAAALEGPGDLRPSPEASLPREKAVPQGGTALRNTGGKLQS